MNRLTKKDQLGDYIFINGEETYPNEICNKLGKLEDLEEEIGCPLEVVFKATTNGIIDFEGKEHTVVLGGYYLFVTENDELIRGIYLKNYQKTWWLKGEKNE